MENEKEVSKLMKEIAYSGFKDIKEADVREALNTGAKIFTLQAERSFGLDGEIKAYADLNIKRAGTTNAPYLNNFDLLVQFNGKERAAKFYKHYGNSFTFKEGTMLLTGGSVTKQFKAKAKTENETKEDEKWHEATAYITPKELEKLENPVPGAPVPVAKFEKSYNCSTEDLVSKLPLAANNNIPQFIDGLNKGEIRGILFDMGNGKTEQHYVRKSGQYKQLDIYDSNGDLKMLSQEGMNNSVPPQQQQQPVQAPAQAPLPAQHQAPAQKSSPQQQPAEEQKAPRIPRKIGQRY